MSIRSKEGIRNVTLNRGGGRPTFTEGRRGGRAGERKKPILYTSKIHVIRKIERNLASVFAGIVCLLLFTYVGVPRQILSIFTSVGNINTHTVIISVIYLFLIFAIIYLVVDSIRVLRVAIQNRFFEQE